MQIDITPGDVTVAAISGSVDSLTAEQLMNTLGSTVREQHVRLVADFTNVAYTSSAGLRLQSASSSHAIRLVLPIKCIRRVQGRLCSRT